MEIRYKLYPYPVLAYYSDDYKDGSFDTTIDLQKDGYNIRIDFMASLTNEGLKKLIHDGQARYVYHLECAQTGFREVVTTEKVAESRMLSDKKICGKLQICPFIVATQDITGYSNLGFHDDYSGTTFEIEAGCVLAVGKQVNATIAKEMEDLANTPSIFSIIRNADPLVTHMIVGIDGQKIVVKLPLNDYYSYKQLAKAPITQPVLNAITIIPALTYALEELKCRSIEEREELSECGWYRTVRKTLLTKFDVDIESNDFNQQNMVVLAQRLINDPLTEAFKVLCDGFGTTGGDEE